MSARYDGGIQVQFGDAQVRDQGCKGVGRDFWPGVGHRGEQGGFTGIRDTDNTHIGDQLKFQAQIAFFGGLAPLGDPGAWLREVA